MPSNLFVNCEGRAVISRRNLLKASAILSFAALPEFALGKGPGETRLLAVLLRGGLDGLFALPPIGESRLEKLRPKINPDETLELDGFFGLHPALENVYDMYQKGEALFVHGTSLPYTGRSHFEGQNIMETGVMAPYASPSGWIGRALDLQGYNSIAASLPVPLILRGGLRADNFYPTWLRNVDDDLYHQLLPLWGEDTALGEVGAQLSGESNNAMNPEVGQRNSLSLLAGEAGKRLRSEAGPRMAVLDHVGFDSHAYLPRDSERAMREVDDAIGAFRRSIGDEVWKKTLIVTVTEFGRTAAENGSLGTDHGWGTAVLVLGGKLKKGGIVADWPGLKKASLFEGRDLKATIDARALYGALMSNVLEIDPELVRREVFDHEPSDLFGAYL